MVGEASMSLATACFDHGITGNDGHDQDDVLYIGFPGGIDDTVNTQAHWAARNFDDFEASIKEIGDRLVKRIS